MKFGCDLLAKQPDLIGSKRLIPEEQTVELDVVDLLCKSGLENVEDLVEIRGGGKSLPYFV